MATRLDVEMRMKKWGDTRFIFMVDIDKLTQINNYFGKPVGDEVIKHVGGLLGAKKPLKYGRCGDDTFYVLRILSDTNEALRKAKAICKAVIRFEWRRLVFDLKVTCSIGIAEFKWKEPLIDTVIRAAKGMKAAKESGGNRPEIGPLYLSADDIRDLEV